MSEVKTMQDNINDDFQVGKEEVIVHAMHMGDIKRQNSYFTGMVLVVEKKRNLLKVVTFGDIKKYIIIANVEYDICLVEKEQQLLLLPPKKKARRKRKRLREITVREIEEE